jgi:hypothetical protein
MMVLDWQASETGPHSSDLFLWDQGPQPVIRGHAGLSDGLASPPARRHAAPRPFGVPGGCFPGPDYVLPQNTGALPTDRP